MSTFTQDLYQVKKARGLTMRQLAAESDLCLGTVINVFKGRDQVSVKNLRKLCAVLGLELILTVRAPDMYGTPD